MSDCQSVTASSQWSCSEDLGQEFWQQWEEYRDYLYRCCIKWMGGNPIDAEDALSRAMLKAWEKVQKFAGKINNFKSWLTSLTRNLCVDIHRERSRGANQVEDIEGYASAEESELVGSEDTPEKALEKAEKATLIKEAIASLPERLRDTFILHFYQQQTHTEIAQAQEITYDNVCKRISLARKQLKEKLSGYFRETEEAERATVGSRKSSTKPEKPEPVESSIVPREIATPIVPERETVSAEIDCVEVIDAEKTEGVEGYDPAQVSGENPRLPVAPVVLSSAMPEATGILVLSSFREKAVSRLGNIASLPKRLRDTFIKHFEQQRSHTEIAEMQDITYDSDR
ncbi:MAG: sigma-70 family RNA polymerase sigma factor [Symploca sp. SIO1C2]|nr:sigma-70 family RNA polymerase sigma factor [Symploca sp. SIO1C2]